MRIVFLILLLLSGCGKDRLVDTAFDEKYTKFKVLAAQRGVNFDEEVLENTSISFGEMPASDTPNSKVIGYCHRGSSYRIVIDQAFWEESDDYTQESLLFHELGHCLLGRGHRSDLNLLVPASIMYPYLVKSSIYHYDDPTYAGYVDELFTRRNDGLSSSKSCEMTVERI